LALHEFYLVKVWLEETSNESIEFEPKQDHLQYTIDHLLQKKRVKSFGTGVSSNSKIVSELDPDAENRQNKSLVVEDAVLDT
jgi:hypothetical protein